MQVSLRGVYSWLRRSRDVPNYQRVVITTELLEVPVSYGMVVTVVVHLNLSTIVDSVEE